MDLTYIIHVGGPQYKVLAFHIRYGGPSVIDRYKVPHHTWEDPITRFPQSI